MSDEIEASVIEFVAKCTGTNIKKIGLNSDLRNNMGVDGDDAEELILKYSQRFGVDISDFNFKRHFEPENSILLPFFIIYWAYLLVRYLLSGKKPSDDFDPVRVSDLVDGVKYGKLRL